MLLLLAGIQAIATFNAKRRFKESSKPDHSLATTGAKVIPLPRNVLKPSKEKLIVNEAVSEEIV